MTTTDLVSRCKFGAFSATGLPLVEDHRRLEAALGARLPIFSWFKDWASGWDFSVANQIAALSTGRYDCMIAWEAWNVSFDEILSGNRDDYIKAFFAGASTYPGRVIIRLFHEMNGNWYPWSLSSSSSLVATPEQWISAWRRIVDLARAANARNVRFMFCPNANDVGGHSAETYWPGDDYVDIIGLDGYNWSWKSDGTPVTTAEQLIAPMYARLCQMHATAEFMVGEIASSDHPNKGTWHEALYRSKLFPRLTAVAFFNQLKEEDWRLDSNTASLHVNQTYLGASQPLSATHLLYPRQLVHRIAATG
jgi:mannan endo-1,4-beta-mannosidase